MKPIELLQNLLRGGMSQKTLADHLGMAQSSIHMYATGKRKKISWDVAEKLTELAKLNLPKAPNE
jgi:predicted transcriptional regulator